jgi:hypothetical protein
MFSYWEFIKENSDNHKYFNAALVKVTSRKTIEEIEDIVGDNENARNLEYTYDWELVEASKKIYKVHFKEPRHIEYLENRFRGRWYKLKFKLVKPIEPVVGLITTEHDKKDLADAIVKYANGGPLPFSDLYFFIRKAGGEYETALKIRLGNRTPDQVKEPERTEFFNWMIQLLNKAVDNKDLDFDTEIFKSAKAVSKFNL